MPRALYPTCVPFSIPAKAKYSTFLYRFHEALPAMFAKCVRGADSLELIYSSVTICLKLNLVLSFFGLAKCSLTSFLNCNLWKGNKSSSNIANSLRVISPLSNSAFNSFNCLAFSSLITIDSSGLSAWYRVILAASPTCSVTVS